MEVVPGDEGGLASPPDLSAGQGNDRDVFAVTVVFEVAAGKDRPMAQEVRENACCREKRDDLG